MVVTRNDTSKPTPSVAGKQPTCTRQLLRADAKSWQGGPARDNRTMTTYHVAFRRAWTMTGTSGGTMTQTSIAAEPYEFAFDPGSTALLVIDMQHDFVEPGGFGEALGNDVTPLQAVIAPCRRVLDAARRTGMLVIHTHEGHSPDLADCPPIKIVRGRGATRIVCGVTTEVSVHTTVREANDRDYECVVLADCDGSYFHEFQRVALEMIKAQGGIFDWVSDSKRALVALAAS
jgi:nicotinamidase-related amidase